jgi:hypothetical protein
VRLVEELVEVNLGIGHATCLQPADATVDGIDKLTASGEAKLAT